MHAMARAVSLTQSFGVTLRSPGSEIPSLTLSHNALLKMEGLITVQALLT